VEVNGTWVGRTPVTVLTGPVGGSLRIVVKRDGFETSTVHSVSAPGSNSIHVDLIQARTTPASQERSTPEPAPSPIQAERAAREVLTNEDVVKMVKAQVPADVIVGKIQRSETSFRLDTQGLISLKEGGVSDDIIRAMAAKQTSGVTPRIPKAPAAPPEPSTAARTPKVTPTTGQIPSIPPPSHTASDYALTLGKVELTGFTGFNLQEGTGQGTEPSFGGSLGLGINRFLTIVLEGSWNSTVSADFEGVEVQARVYDLNGGLQVNFPNNSRVVPYVVAGGGLLHATAGVKFFGADVVGDSATEFSPNFGGGLKVHISNTFGVRLEGKAFHPIDGGWGGRVTAGVFYQFK
jgi:hypothetical protein